MLRAVGRAQVFKNFGAHLGKFFLNLPCEEKILTKICPGLLLFEKFEK